MPRPVVILHGYSDTQKSFRPLRTHLREHGFDVRMIYLGDYLTLEDEITIEDLAKAFEKALAGQGIPTGAGGFDLVVHSTGALVAREWMTRYYLEPGRPCPVAHFLMLAPANFGSPLAHKGRTMFGRLIKGWRSNFEVGERVLHALEMASPYTWTLAERDLFGDRSFYHPDECMAAVLVGSKPYQKGFRKLVDKNGSDGTVYVCTANLNATALTARFGRADEGAEVDLWVRTASPVAFGVLPDRDHGSITRPGAAGESDLGAFIVDFLRLGSAATYESFRQRCADLTDATLPQDAVPAEEIFHSYQNVVTRVTDDLGMDVPDYFLEFYEPPKSAADRNRFDRTMQRMHAEVLEGVHTYRARPSHRSFLFDLTDLGRLFAGDEAVCMSLSAARVSSLIGYTAGADNDIGELDVPRDERRFWRPNETLLADLVIERVQADRVFRLLREG